MMIKVILLLCAAIGVVVASDDWVVQLKEGENAELFAAEHGLQLKHKIPHLENYFVFEALSDRRAYLSQLAASSDTLFMERQIPQKRYTRTTLIQQVRARLPLMGKSGDPLYGSQWHLHGNSRVSVNAEAAWGQGLGGRGIRIAIVDDGLQHTHPDLSANYESTYSWDFNDNDADPTPRSGDGHGTSAAGVAAAVRNNGHCGTGVAPDAKLVGLRTIADYVTDSTEALALGHNRDEIDIYSCSWGPADDGHDMVAPGYVTQQILKSGATFGRKGLGNIFVWAGGNGYTALDNCNYDGYANSPYTIAIGALAYDGHQSFYSEDCAALMAVTPSSGAGHGITTTDITGYGGYDPGECTNDFGGTSSATPLAAGIIAILLQKYPGFNKRDVEHVIAKGATKVDETNLDWNTNARGYHHSHHYGFGNLVIPKLLETAALHIAVPKERISTSGPFRPYKAMIPDDGRAWTGNANIIRSGITFVEHVMLTLELQHPSRGELAVTLISPAGTQSKLADRHLDMHRDYPTGGWTFTTVRHWGEQQADGVWTVKVEDKVIGNRSNGSILSYKLEVRGY